MTDDAGPDQVGRRVDHAPDDTCRFDGAADHSARVHGFQVGVCELAGLALEIPPRDAVLGADHGGGLTERSSKTLRNRGQAVSLDRHEHGVRIGDRVQVVGAWRLDGVLAFCFDHPKAVAAERIQVGAPGDQHHVQARAGQTPAEKAADRARAQDRKLHLGASCSATWRR